MGWRSEEAGGQEGKEAAEKVSGVGNEEGVMGSREVSLSRLEVKGLSMNHLNWGGSFPE